MSRELTFKILVIGDSAVGKTSLVQRLCRNIFTETTEETIGVEFVPHSLIIDDQEVKLQIWDTAGQEQYRTLSRAYYRNAIGVLLVFSYENTVSFDHLESWLNDVRSLCHPNAKVILVGNKSDLIEERNITNSQITQFAQSNNLEFIEASAKDNSNVSEAFYNLAREILNSVKSNEINLGPPHKKIIETPKKEEEDCC
jgi:small GTP-binding protein